MKMATAEHENTHNLTNSNRGANDCPCIDSSIILESLVGIAIPCNITTEENIVGGIYLPGGGVTCYPYTYGSDFCNTHDNEFDPACKRDGPPSSIPAYCHERWCYVDAEACKRSSNDVVRSGFFTSIDNLFYSYSTCDSSIDPWQLYKTTSKLVGKTLKITVPSSNAGRHYKLNESGVVVPPSGEEYYDESIPFQGPIIDYVNSIVTFSNSMEGANYTSRSHGSDSIYPSSSYTASVNDVYWGLSDMAVGTFWVTSERLLMTSFTTPFRVDYIKLMARRPIVDKSFGFQAQKLAEPFVPALWFVLITSIVVTAILATWIKNSTSRKQNTAWLKFWKKRQGKEKTLRRRLLLTTRLIIDSVLEHGIYFFGGAVEQQQEGATLPYKVLMFGFAFLILITVSAYVANLAAFLTKSGAANFINTMEKAQSANAVICAHLALRNDLEKKWPNNKFLWYESSNSQELEYYDTGRCQVIALGIADYETKSDFLDELCSRDLVYTKELLLEIPMAFPINDQLTAGFSYWMHQAEKERHRSYSDFVEDYKKPLSCDLESVAVERDGEERLTLTNMALPMIIFFVFTIIAVVMQFYVSFYKKSGAGHKFVGSCAATYSEYKSTRFQGSPMDKKPDDDDKEKALSMDVDRQTSETSHMDSELDDDFVENKIIEDYSVNSTSNHTKRRSRVSFASSSAIVNEQPRSNPRPEELSASLASQSRRQRLLENAIKLESIAKTVREEMEECNCNHDDDQTLSSLEWNA